MKPKDDSVQPQPEKALTHHLLFSTSDSFLLPSGFAGWSVGRVSAPVQVSSPFGLTLSMPSFSFKPSTNSSP